MMGITLPTNEILVTGLLIDLVCKSHEMERSFRGRGWVWTNLTESHEMRRNWEKLSPF